MDKKFEQLIECIVNEDTDAARAIFHDIVVGKSREIYESLMDAEQDVEQDELGMDNGDNDDGLADKISGELAGEDMDGEDGEGEYDDEESEEEGDDEFADVGEDDFEDENGEEETEEMEDRLVDVEDKLDELMAEFDKLLQTEKEEHSGNLEESASMQKVAAPSRSDNNETKSPVARSKKIATTAKPVKIDTAAETGRSAPQVKEQPSKYGNAAGRKTSPKLAAAPKPKASAKPGNTKSPLGEGAKQVAPRSKRV